MEFSVQFRVRRAIGNTPWADFIVVDRDYFEIPESEIDDIQVLETWVGGERVYDASQGDAQ